jgi:MOSC domain-containing protein YiiM
MGTVGGTPRAAALRVGEIMSSAERVATRKGEAVPGAGEGRVRGRVRRIHRKPEVPNEHGLPKRAVSEARLTHRGVEGDFNRYRHEEKRDDADMAVLILPYEVIAELNQEGWPVQPGDLGENLTTEGIGNEAFVPGRRFRVGKTVVEISKECTPCTNLYLLPYVGNVRGPAFLQTTLGRRGWYARVLQEGLVRAHDPVELVPESVG